MASEWIKWTKGLHCKKEVLGIAEALGVPPVHAAGLCMVFWEWLDDNVSEKDVDEDGNAHVTLGPLQLQFLDRLVMADGFAAALAAVGWLQPRNGALVVPNFTRHNGQTGKTRALTAERVAHHRRRCNDFVTVRALQNRYQRREEKRREENLKPSASAEGSSEPNTVSSEPPPAPDPPVFVYPTVGSKQTWGLTPQFLHTLQERYPNLDVLEECRKALAWTEANPQRRKTAQGMPRFLVNWLNKAVDGRCAPPTPALLIAKSEEAAAEAQRAKILAELRQAAKR